MKSKITQNQIKKWVCGECGKEFKYNSEKVRHERSHVAQFECKICSKKFSFLSAVRRHEKQHERSGSVQCDICKRKFRDLPLLNRHMQYSHKGTFTCKKCDNIFNSEVALQTHMKTHKPQSERKYRCSFNNCNKSFNFTHHLKHHELTHTNLKQYFCSTCGKGFIQLHHLKVHQKSHEPETWLPCLHPECKKIFTNEYARKRHLMKHKIKLECEIPPDANYRTQNSENILNISRMACGKTMSKENYTTHVSQGHKNDQTSIDKLNDNVSNKLINDSEETIYVFPLEEDDAITKVLKNYQDVPINTAKVLNNNNTNALNGIELSNNAAIKYSQSVEDINMNNKEDKNEISENMSIDKVDNSIITCTATIGCCIVTGSSEISSNCICAQIVADDEELKDLVKHELNEINTEGEIIGAHVNNSKPKYNTKVNEKSNDADNLKCDTNMCDTCDCAKTCPINPKNRQENSLALTELKTDGTVKIKEAFDFDFEVSSFDSKSTNMEKDTNNKIITDLKMVNPNNCKDVLGNCIVSGNSTIGEECICAKMTLNTEEPMTDQEIDDITPNPKPSWT